MTDKPKWWWSKARRAEHEAQAAQAREEAKKRKAEKREQLARTERAKAFTRRRKFQRAGSHRVVQTNQGRYHVELIGWKGDWFPTTAYGELLSPGWAKLKTSYHETLEKAVELGSQFEADFKAQVAYEIRRLTEFSNVLSPPDYEPRPVNHDKSTDEILFQAVKTVWEGQEYKYT